MISSKVKKYLKNSPLIFNLLVGILFLYIKFSYITSRWKITWDQNVNDDYIKNSKPILFAIWHSHLAYSIKIFGKYKEVKALASPHSDGRIIAGIVNRFGYGVIAGSSYQNANGALREILSNLKDGINIVITPDGPRGPAKGINSAITKIASKYGYPVIAASCKADRYFTLNSWDKMIIPKPFSIIEVKFSRILGMTGDEEQDKLLLKNELDKYTA